MLGGTSLRLSHLLCEGWIEAASVSGYLFHEAVLIALCYFDGQERGVYNATQMLRYLAHWIGFQIGLLNFS